ncbi:uncharacterized protein [Choristoneura fumiferana]|uniref:uncharacterized protein n=1 Tax=Choristoneura fumiferana TaxID=7141 RepID=UPI003D158FFE
MVVTRNMARGHGVEEEAAGPTAEAPCLEVTAPTAASDTESEAARPAPAAPLAPTPQSPPLEPRAAGEHDGQSDDVTRRRRALAEARLELAEARVAALEAGLLCDDRTSHTVPPLTPTSPVISGATANLAAHTESPQLVHSGRYSVTSQTYVTGNFGASGAYAPRVRGTDASQAHASGGIGESATDALGARNTDASQAYASDGIGASHPCAPSYDIGASQPYAPGGDIGASQPYAPGGGISAPQASAPSGGIGASGTYAPGHGNHTDTGQTLKDLATAILEVARGGRPASNRCLQKRSWKHRCKSKQCDAPGCEYFHHKLLHGGGGDSGRRSDEGARAQHEVAHAANGNTAADTSCARCTSCCEHAGPPAAVTTARAPRARTHTLLKVIPVVISGPRGEMNTYALLDDGSTVTLLTTEAAQHIGVSGPNDPFYIEAVAGARIDAASSQRVTFTIRGKHVNECIDIQARTIDRLDISAQSVPVEALASCEHLTSISEQLVYESGVPTVLIGQDNWALLLSSEVRRGPAGQLVASRMPLGWALHGQSCYSGRVQGTERCGHMSTNESLDRLVKEHFNLESLGVEPRRPQGDPETRALQILEKTTRALPEGGYETGMLWKNEGKTFPDNYAATLSRLQGVEKRLRKDPVLSQKYSEQIKSMVQNGYAELAPATPSSHRMWYLPHFPVVNDSKPGKIRIVHDAAARTHGVCLNDFLLTGPDLLQSLLGVLMRFRQKPVAVAADIKDMFLRISIRREDRDALRFLWRDDPTSTPTEYRMRSVLFGATSSPSTAIYIKNYNAQINRSEYPDAVQSIIRNHYMDDFLQSFDDVEEAQRVSRAVDAVHRRGNFVLQKWAANDPAAVAGLASEPAAPDVRLSKEEKVLGLVWRPADDTLGFNFRKVDPSYLDQQTSKRQLLSTAMALYDPLGLATPITAQAKRILQSIWRLKIGWDEPLPHPIKCKWREWLIALQKLKGVQIPRCYQGYSKATTLELHVFVDASEQGYAAAAYWRSVTITGDISVSLAAAKGRVAPLKIISVPRLELQGAVLGGRLAHTVAEEHDRRADRRVFWSDSRTVLAWLRADARSFKPFVAHRVAELEETTAGAEWRWVPSAHNVADDATRDLQSDLTATHRWFRGPSFLYDDEATWPRERDPLTTTDTGEERINAATTRKGPRLTEALPDAARFSSWLRLVRATARVLQFIERCRSRTTTTVSKRTRRTAADDPTWTATQPGVARAPRGARSHSEPTPPSAAYVPLAAQYTRRAELLWARASQEERFPNELRHVASGKAVDTHSRLHRLSLIIDQHGILRLRSRIAAAADIEQEMYLPAVLDGDHHYCRLYIDWIHRRLHHSGVESVVNEVRQRYWILRLRPTVRTVIRRCQPCRLRRAAPSEPPTGDLPPCRLAHHQRPFTHTGVDYFGPLSVTIARHHEKRYVALFTCLTTRAVHLEVAASLSTDAAVLALRRMIARRGYPDTIWSDNGANFRGADAELRRAALTALHQEADVRHIDWRFIPASAPFMGGAWERMVSTVKTALAATLHERHPYEDVLHTLLTEVEHTVNSRPLSHVSVASEDEEALTPNHFLLGGPSKVPLPGTFTKVDEMGRSHWRASQRLADLFWQRWVREVLPTLSNRREPRGRGEAIKEGDVVIIVDPNLPRNVWPKGRVERVYPGADGVVRVVDVRTRNGLMRRPTKRLIILPIE